jgi:hypothetical protein
VATADERRALMEALEQGAEEKVLADHFARVFKVGTALRQAA